MGVKYAVVVPVTGVLIGFFDTDLTALPGPSGAVGPLTDAQWDAWAENPSGYLWNFGTGTVVPNVVSGPATGYSTAAAGCTVHSTGTPAINSTYPCDPVTMAWLGGVVLNYVLANSAFPNAAAAFSIVDINGTVFSFGTQTLFKNFVKALINYVAQCQQYDLAGGSLPSSPVVIP